MQAFGRFAEPGWGSRCWESHKPQTFCLWSSATYWKMHKCFYGWVIWFWGVIESQSLLLLPCGGKSFSPHSIQDPSVRLGGEERYQEGPRAFSELSFSAKTKWLICPPFLRAVLEAGGFPPLSHPSWSCSFVLATASISRAQLRLLRQVSILCLRPLRLQTLHKALDHS